MAPLSVVAVTVDQQPVEVARKGGKVVPYKSETPCGFPRCRYTTRNRPGYCDEHKAAARNKLAANRPGYMENTSAWKRFKEALRGNGNVLCQRIEHGERCNQPVEIYHHLLGSNQRPDLIFDPQNVIGLCRGHHPNTDGTPDWKPGVDYVPTIWQGLLV